jgi:2-C-methyl-D-erythritol 4-phosphate cytidylyltransferase
MLAPQAAADRRAATATATTATTATAATAAGAAVVVLAGGSGTRLGGQVNKVYLPLGGRRLISWSFIWAAQVPSVGPLVLVVRRQDAEAAGQMLREDLPAGMSVEVVTGGDTRHGSEQSALDHLAPRIEDGQVDVVVLHDGARPLADPELFASVIGTARSVGGAIPALTAEGLLTADAALVGSTSRAPMDATAPAAHLVRVQTPQAFRALPLLRAYAQARVEGFQGTDTASSIERYTDLVVRAVPGSPANLKVTYPPDLVLAEKLLAMNDHRTA